VNLDQNTVREAYRSFGLDSSTSELMGHGLALQLDGSQLDKPARETIEACIFYKKAADKNGGCPFVYPTKGFGEVAFRSARRSNSYSLNTPLQEILYDDSGKVTGVKIKDPTTKKETVVKTSKVIADPAYFSSDPKRATLAGKIVRAICVLAHPVVGTGDGESAHIIIPASTILRRNDIYISVVSSKLGVCPAGFYLASVSTTLESDANAQGELQPGLSLLGNIEEMYVTIGQCQPAKLICCNVIGFSRSSTCMSPLMMALGPIRTYRAALTLLSTRQTLPVG
jgi:Rab GDP dissociation inhibitor